MEEDVHFNFSVGPEALKMLLQAMEYYVDQWPGGKPEEQDDLKDMLNELRKAYLELKFME